MGSGLVMRDEVSPQRTSALSPAVSAVPTGRFQRLVLERDETRRETNQIVSKIKPSIIFSLQHEKAIDLVDYVSVQ